MEQPFDNVLLMRPGSRPLYIAPVRKMSAIKVVVGFPLYIPLCIIDFVTSRGQTVSHARLALTAPLQNGLSPPSIISLLRLKSIHIIKELKRNEFLTIVIPDRAEFGSKRENITFDWGGTVVRW